MGKSSKVWKITNNGVNDANLWLSSTVERGYRIEMQRRIIVLTYTSRFRYCSSIILSSASVPLPTSLGHELMFVSTLKMFDLSSLRRLKDSPEAFVSRAGHRR